VGADRPLGIHALGTIVVAICGFALTTQTEHLSPEVAARLEQEGVANPDAVFNTLVEEAAGTQEPRGGA